MIGGVRTLPAALVVAGMCLSVGCVHNTLGQPPTQFELRNDGTPESKNHLYNRYKVTYADGYFSRPYSLEYSSEATSDAALNYLTDSAEAEEELATLPVALDRFHQSASFYASIVGVFMAMGTAVGMYSSLSQGAFADIIAGGNQSVQGAQSLALFMVSGMAAGLIASLPILLIAEITIKPIVRSVAGPSYRASARAYNEDLSRRIDAAVDDTLRRQRAHPPVSAPAAPGGKVPLDPAPPDPAPPDPPPGPSSQPTPDAEGPPELPPAAGGDPV